MTDEVERGALELMAKVEEMGGAVAAIEKGFQKSEIERSAYDVALGIDSGERVVVGLNRFRVETEERYEPLRVDPAIEQEQRDRPPGPRPGGGRGGERGGGGARGAVRAAAGRPGDRAGAARPARGPAQGALVGGRGGGAGRA